MYIDEVKVKGRGDSLMSAGALILVRISQYEMRGAIVIRP